MFAVFPELSLALTIRISVADLYCFLRFGAFSRYNSYFRCGSVVLSVFRRFPWHSQFAFSLRTCSVVSVSELSLALTIRITLWLCNIFCVSELSLALTIHISAEDL